MVFVRQTTKNLFSRWKASFFREIYEPLYPGLRRWSDPLWLVLAACGVYYFFANTPTNTPFDSIYTGWYRILGAMSVAILLMSIAYLLPRKQIKLATVLLASGRIAFWILVFVFLVFNAWIALAG